jgi:hypothetical protein
MLLAAALLECQSESFPGHEVNKYKCSDALDLPTLEILNHVVQHVRANITLWEVL